VVWVWRSGQALLRPEDSIRRLTDVRARLRELGKTARGRLGVHILNTASGEEYGHLSDERFLMLSSFKVLASALVLHRVDAGLESLDRRIPYTSGDRVTCSPVTA
jgi:beta-lactamase class A